MFILYIEAAQFIINICIKQTVIWNRVNNTDKHLNRTLNDGLLLSYKTKLKIAEKKKFD